MRTKRKHTKWSIVSSREGKGHVPNVSKAKPIPKIPWRIRNWGYKDQERGVL